MAIPTDDLSMLSISKRVNLKEYVKRFSLRKSKIQKYRLLCIEKCYNWGVTTIKSPLYDYSADLNIIVVSGGVSSETDGILGLVNERGGVLILISREGIADALGGWFLALLEIGRGK